MSGVLQAVFANQRAFTSVPDAPTIGTATATGSTTATVAFTAPANNGGSTITLYTATSSPGGITGTLSQSGSGTITVSGLTGGTNYTFTVKATNAVGQSAASNASNQITTTPIIGQAYGGGYYAGDISTAGNGIADYRLVVCDVTVGEAVNLIWGTYSNTGITSTIDGPSNSAALAALYPNASVYAAAFCEAVNSGGYTDWYMPAKNELEICYYNLKPDSTSNNTSYGSNANAVPARGSNYTSGTPAQTTASLFIVSNAQAFDSNNKYYWPSTEISASQASRKLFTTGAADNANKSTSGYRVRAVRRVAI